MRDMPRVLAPLASVSLALSLLLSAGIAWGLPQVESRSRDPAWGQGTEGSEHNSGLSMLKQMEFLQQEVQELRGKLEEQSYQMQQLQEHQKKLYLDLDRRLREGGPVKVSGVSSFSLDEREDQVKDLQGGVDARVSSQFSTDQTQLPLASTVTALPSSEEMMAEEKTYQNAYHLIQNKDYDSALQAFKSLVNTYPQGKYVPNAYYWLGEIYLVRSNFDLASEYFDNVYRNYPQHPKAADSLLKLGYVEYAKGQWKRSQELFAQVKNQFPGSTSAQLANSRLEKMRQEGNL